MEIQRLRPGQAFTFKGLGDRPTTLPVFLRALSGHPKRIVNLASGAIFEVVDDHEDVDVIAGFSADVPWRDQLRVHLALLEKR